MDQHHSDAEKTLDHARKVLESRFIHQAAEPDAEAEINRKLDGKLNSLHGRSKTMDNLRALTSQASELWRNRGRLNRKQLIYLSAGLLYFISPVDAITDVIPLLGYIDDVAVLGWILTQITPVADKIKLQVSKVKDEAIEQTTDRLVEKGRDALNEVVDQRSEELLEKIEDAAEDALAKYVSAAVVGLWGTTTAAAISLALSVLTGGYSTSWMLYVGLTSALVLSWNLALAVVVWHRFHTLKQPWRERLPKIIGARLLKWRNMLALGVPILSLAALLIAHIRLNS